jgi:hypothetical protein
LHLLGKKHFCRFSIHRSQPLSLFRTEYNHQRQVIKFGTMEAMRHTAGNASTGGDIIATAFDTYMRKNIRRMFLFFDEQKFRFFGIY